jgi:hypothetical protein
MQNRLIQAWFSRILFVASIWNSNDILLTVSKESFNFVVCFNPDNDCRIGDVPSRMTSQVFWVGLSFGFQY